MEVVEIGGTISSQAPFVFEPGTVSSSDVDSWVAVGQFDAGDALEINFIVYSNVKELNSYLDTELWSTDYYT